MIALINCNYVLRFFLLQTMISLLSDISCYWLNFVDSNVPLDFPHYKDLSLNGARAQPFLKDQVSSDSIQYS
jgi:hypothetical protein